MVVPAAHHGSVVVAKVPLLICSLPVGGLSAANAWGRRPTTTALSAAAAATATAVTAAAVRRRFGGVDTKTPGKRRGRWRLVTDCASGSYVAGRQYVSRPRPRPVLTGSASRASGLGVGKAAA